MPADIKVVSFQNNNCAEAVGRCVQAAPKALTIMDIFAMKLEVFKKSVEIVKDREILKEHEALNSKLQITKGNTLEKIEILKIAVAKAETKGLFMEIEKKKKELSQEEEKLSNTKKIIEGYKEKIDILREAIRKRQIDIEKSQGVLADKETELRALKERQKMLSPIELIKVNDAVTLVNKELKNRAVGALNEQGKEILDLRNSLLKVGK